MNKKLILLMLALPLILMLCLFTATSTVSLAISVHVERVEINDDAVVYIDLEKPYDVKYTVYPTNAENKKVSYSTEQVGEDTFATLTFEDGKIVPQSCGKAKVVVTTADGGYKDSFIVVVSTDKLQSINSTISSETIKIGEKTNINTSFTPASAQYQTQLKYEIVEGAGIVSVNSKGEITGENVGSATVKTYCTINEEVSSLVNIQVENSHPIEFLKKQNVLTTMQNEITMGLFVDETETVTDISVDVINESGEVIDTLIDPLDLENETFTYEFSDNEPCVLILRLTGTTSAGEFTDECELIRIGKIQAEWDGATTAIKVGGTLEVPITILPSSMEIGYEIQLSENGAYISCEMKEGYLIVKAVNTNEVDKYASETITLTIWLVEQPDEKVVLTKLVNTYE